MNVTPYSEPVVKLYVLDGPAVGRIVDRPLSEVHVLLPWERFRVEVSTDRGTVGVKLPTLFYRPIRVTLFNKQLYVLSCYTDFVSFEQLFEIFMSDLAKEIAL